MMLPSEPMIRQWMENVGCDRIFVVENSTREGVQELIDYLNRNETNVYCAIDVSRAKMHWLRRLDPEKCRNVDVM